MSWRRARARRIVPALLASSSLAALVIGGGAPSAMAACYSTPFPNADVGNQTGVCITNQTFSGTVGSSGTISPNGIVVTHSSIGNNTAAGQIFDAGTLVGGIAIDSQSAITNNSGAAILIVGPTFQGSIGNAGTISGADNGITVTIVTTFQGGITTLGTVTASRGFGIDVSRVATFGSTSAGGGITNSGTITAANGGGIGVFNVTSFQGGISNNNTGTISAGGAGIFAANDATFLGGITNAGTISAGGDGIQVNTTIGGSTVSFAGDIANLGTITGRSTGILVAHVLTFQGGITNAGTIAAGGKGIFVVSGAIFRGTSAGASITNSGTILAGATGIFVAAVPTFLGRITNSGTITATATNADGIFVDNVTTFLGGISNRSGGRITAGRNGIFVSDGAMFGNSSAGGGIINSGMISAGATGIFVAAVSTFQGGITNAGTITAGGRGIFVAGGAMFGNSSAGGGITNSGRISAGATGIFVAGGSTFVGGISNGSSGTISAGINGIFLNGVSTFQGGVANSGSIAAAVNGILVNGVSTFLGGISNSRSGTIRGQVGITVANVAVFGNAGTGGITNAGTITASSTAGIQVSAITTFLGGITNSGNITATNHVGIVVGSIAVFGSASAGGGITNSGTIIANTGIAIGSGVTFAGGAAIVNSGTITGTLAAIDTRNATSPVTIDQTGGLISGAIRLSANADVLNISGGTIAGNISGQGASDSVSFALGSGAFTYGSAFGFSGIHQVNVSSGTVILDGPNSATSIAVAGGNLQVGDAASPSAKLTGAVDVTGGILSGYGTVAGAVTIDHGGMLAPGGTIGPLTVVGGPLTFNAGSRYAVQITDTTASKTLVTGSPGTAVINGGTVLLMAPFATLGADGGTTYTILTATGGRTGTFAGLTVNSTNSSVNFTGAMSLSYDPDDVFLNVGRGFTVLSAPPGANINQQNAVNGINNAILSNDPVPSGFQALPNLSGPSLLNALTQISGEVGASFSQGAFQAGNSFLNLMLNPFVDNRGGNSGDGSFGPIGFAPERPAPAGDQAAAASGAFASINKAAPHDATLGSTQRFQAWGAAYGGTGTVSGDPASGSHNTNAQVYGFGGGFDYRVSPDSVVGLALAGGGTNWSLDQGLGSGRSDMFQAGLYGSTHWGAAYLSGALAWSFHDVTTNRTVTAAGTDMLQANFRANVLSERVEGGYRTATPWLGLTPYAAVQVQSLFLPGYGEGATSGSAQFALSYQSQSTTTTRTELGARFDKSWLDTGWLAEAGGLLTLYGRAAWAHDFNSNVTATALFQTLPGSNFVVNGARPASDGALLTAGGQYRLTNGWSFLAKFDGELSSTTTIYSGTGVIRKEW